MATSTTGSRRGLRRVHPPIGPRSVAPPASASVYRPRRPTATPLYPVVQHHLETFLAAADDGDADGSGLPPWVEREFRAYLECGILAHGFARARCGDCARERMVPFSCKVRGVCPSCTTPRMGMDPSSSPARYRWATLLARIYEVLPLRCPACGGEMKVLAFITDPLTVQRILRHLAISPRPPPVSPPRRPPQRELAFDQTPAFDPAEPEPIPEVDFDQSVPDEFD